MNRPVTTTIDPERCNGCGLCITVCPSRTLSIADGKARVTGAESMGCGHCAAICPTGAIQVGALPAAYSFSSFTLNHRWLPPGKYEIAPLVQLMASRRSCRNYQETPVPKGMLTDLITIGTTAPSGTNSQAWTFTLLPERRDVARLGDQVAAFFQTLNSKAEKPLLRLLSKLFYKDRLAVYYRRYYASIQRGLDEWRQHGTDRLFHGAPAVIMVGGNPTAASCAQEDALLATQNILLAAHAMGLGSCLIGFAVHAVNNTPSLKELLEIPAAETVYACIALGFPDEKYQRVANRKPPLIRQPGLH